MPFNGSGTYSPPSLPGSFNPATSGQDATPDDWNALLTDLSSALSQTITSNGESTITADIPMNSFKFTGVANAATRTQFPSMGQIQDGGGVYAAAGGTANALTLTLSPVITACVVGQRFRIKQGAAANSGAVTLNINGIGAGPVKWPDGTALFGGAIPANAMFDVEVQDISTPTAPVFHLQTVGSPSLPLAGGSLTGPLNEAQGANIASATTTDIGAATGNYVNVTGTTTITGLGTVQAGTERTVTFSGALTLTHNGTSLILPGAANILTAAGDSAIFRSLGSGNWKCVAYQKASGSSVVAQTSIGFLAKANGVGAPGALAKMSLANASFNVGGYWSNSTNRFTPPAGLYSFQVGLTCAISNSYLEVYLYKNGAAIAHAYQGNSQTWQINVGISITDQANGTDYYEAYWAGGAIAVPLSTQAWFSAIGIGP